MTAGEDQAQPIVGDGHVVLGAAPRLDRRQLGLDRHIATELLGLVAQAPATAQAVDCSVPGRGRDPRARVGRDPAFWPDLERGDEGVLDGFLGEVEIAEDADERRDRPPLLFAEEAVDDLVGGGVGKAQPALAPTAWSSGTPVPVSQIGRTSIVPARMPGHCAASSRASSRSLASIR